MDSPNAPKDKTPEISTLDPYFLKGHVLISRRIPKGPYNSIRVEVMEEYNLAETTFEEKWDDLAERFYAKLVAAGIVTSP